jgi:deazaflavin-dependent oxidoreductase (nitroreductase family)
MSDRTMSPADIKAYHRGIIEEFRANGGRVGGTAAGAPLLLLTTSGAKSGKASTTPVSYTRDFSRFVIIAAKQGAPTNPDWYHNLVANPEVTVEVGDETFRAMARVAEGEERQRLFDQMAAARPNFIEFQSRTSRQLPVVVLERVLDRSTDYNAFNRSLVEEFQARGGKVGGIFEGLPLLLLTTTGAKSGQPRVAPVIYGTDNGRYLVVASKGGSPTHPDWYYNLRANPVVTVDLGTESFPARASIAEGAERERLFNLLVGVIPKLLETQANTTRQLPIVVLERTG